MNQKVIKEEEQFLKFSTTSTKSCFGYASKNNTNNFLILLIKIVNMPMKRTKTKGRGKETRYAENLN